MPDSKHLTAVERLGASRAVLDLRGPVDDDGNPARGELGMDYRQVGTTDVQLSAIGLGGAWLGHDLSHPTHVPTAIDVLRAVDKCGVNWLDTSENDYDTSNEAVIGIALRELDDSFLVCSKAAGCSTQFDVNRKNGVPTVSAVARTSAISQ